MHLQLHLVFSTSRLGNQPLRPGVYVFSQSVISRSHPALTPSSDAARARRPDNMQTHHIHQLQQTNPSADVGQKLLNTAPVRKESTQDAATHTQTASSPVATVLARARGQKRVANYDEIGHRTGPRETKRTLYIADAKQATGIGDGPTDHGNPDRSENARHHRE